LDIAELRLSLITLAAKPAYRHLSPTDFDLAYGLAKQMTRTKSAKGPTAYSLGGVPATGRPIDSL
jgi:hypothetical protein